MITGTKSEREANIFGAFLKFTPLFAGEALRDWAQPDDDPPDILCTTTSGNRLGVELRAWLDEGEMNRGISYERSEQSLMTALGDQGENVCRNVQRVWLCLKDSARIRDEDRADFRNQTYLKIVELDNAMDDDDRWSPQGLGTRDFSACPVLRTYLSEIRCFPRKAWRRGRFVMLDSISGQPWIHLPPRGGAYSEDIMVNALYAAIDDKRNHYSGPPPGLDGFYLLIHYDQAALYNSPVETPSFTYEDAARLGTGHIRNNPGVFDKIFLYLAIEPGEKAFQLY